jgi:hypothetical protein
MNDDSDLFHLEKGGQWSGATDIAQYVHTKDMMLDDAHPMFLGHPHRLDTVAV